MASTSSLGSLFHSPTLGSVRKVWIVLALLNYLLCVCVTPILLAVEMLVSGLGANIFCILSGLRALSRRSDCSLHVVRVSDVFSHIPSVELVQAILSAFPRLHTLSVSFDLKNQLEGNRPEGHSSSLEAEIPGRDNRL